MRTYSIVVLLLLSQLFILFTASEKYKEKFENNASTIVVPSIKGLDVQKYGMLVEAPGKMKDNINHGIQTLIDATNTTDEYATLYERNDNYKDEKKRKAYKHIDYLLEKFKLHDKKMYDSIVPKYSEEDYKKMHEEDDKAMETKPDSE